LKTDLAKLARAFNPRCVVVVGDSRRNNFGWLRAQSNFKGKLYSVQVNPETVKEIRALGIENHASLMDIPEEIDLVIVAVPREAVLRVVEDCIRKDVAAVHLFAAGFAETDTKEGIELERQLADRARQANLHVIGPNCFGIFNPGIGLRQSEEQYTGVSGQAGFISQSGNLALAFSLEAHLQGIDISKSVSFGNGIVLDSADYLEYLGRDPETKVIGMYLEGVKDGKRLLRVLGEIAAKKPVLIWKGGRTEEGSRAIASHTGSLAVPQTIWDAAVSQHGAMKISSMEEMIDTVKALLYLPPVRGDGVGVAGGSGGQSVIVADVFAEAGLRVSSLTPESYEELASFFVLIGGGYPNPIDTGGNVNRLEIRRIMQVLERDANIDNLVMIVSTKPGWNVTPQQVEENIRLLDDIKKATQKPVMALVYFSTHNAEEVARGIMLKLREKGIPAFPSVERGARALKNALDYYRSQSCSSARIKN
jgi:acyl-CoA synthetase (NDP forming)